MLGTEPHSFPSPYDRHRDSEAEAKAKPSPFRKKGEKFRVANFSPNMTSNKSEQTTAVKFSMTGWFIRMVGHSESMMDCWIDSTALLKDINMLSNYITILLLHKVTAW